MRLARYLIAALCLLAMPAMGISAHGVGIGFTVTR